MARIARENHDIAQNQVIRMVEPLSYTHSAIDLGRNLTGLLAFSESCEVDAIKDSRLNKFLFCYLTLSYLILSYLIINSIGFNM